MVFRNCKSNINFDIFISSRDQKNIQKYAISPHIIKRVPKTNHTCKPIKKKLQSRHTRKKPTANKLFNLCRSVLRPVVLKCSFRRFLLIYKPLGEIDNALSQSSTLRRMVASVRRAKVCNYRKRLGFMT